MKGERVKFFTHNSRTLQLVSCSKVLQSGLHNIHFMNYSVIGCYFCIGHLVHKSDGWVVSFSSCFLRWQGGGNHTPQSPHFPSWSSSLLQVTRTIWSVTGPLECGVGMHASPISNVKTCWGINANLPFLPREMRRFSREANSSTFLSFSSQNEILRVLAVSSPCPPH